MRGSDIRHRAKRNELLEYAPGIATRTSQVVKGVVKIQFSVPQALYSRVVYLTGVTISGAGNQEAVNFFGFLRSAEAKRILMKYGFELQ